MTNQYAREDVEAVLRDMHVSVWDFTNRMDKLRQSRANTQGEAHRREEEDMERKGYVRDVYGHWRPGR